MNQQQCSKKCIALRSIHLLLLMAIFLGGMPLTTYYAYAQTTPPVAKTTPPAAQTDSGQSAPVTLPLLSGATDHPVVQMSLDGKTTGTFLLNTNTAYSSLSTAMATKLGLTPHSATDSQGKPVEEYGTTFQSVTVSHARLGNLSLASAEFLSLSPEYLANYVTSAGQPVDGILGMNVLKDHAFLLDMANHQITFWAASGVTPADLQTVTMADASAVPLNPVTGSDQFAVTAGLTNGQNTKTESLAVDTSQHGNFMSSDLASQLDLHDPDKPISYPYNGVTYSLAYVVVPTLSLGPLSVPNIQMGYSVGKELPLSQPHLGDAFFSQFRVLFDFAQKTMYVQVYPTAIASDSVAQTKAVIDYVPLVNHEAPLLPVRLSEQITGTFFVDSGTANTMITDKMAAKLGLTPKPYLVDGKPVIVDGKPQQTVTLNLFRVAQFDLASVTAFVIPTSFLAGVVRHPVDGLLGSNVLQHFAMEIDSQHQQMILWYPGNLSATDLAMAGFGDVTPIPMSLGDTGLFTVPVNFENGSDNATHTIEIDTGASNTSISHAFAAQLHLPMDGKPIKASTFYGTVPIDFASVPEMDMSTLKLYNHPVEYPVNEKDFFPESLGMDVFFDHATLFDFPAKECYIRSGSAPSNNRVAPLAADVAFQSPSEGLGAGSIVLPVTLNQTQPVNLLWSTASPSQSLTESIVTKLGLNTQPLLDNGQPVLSDGKPVLTTSVGAIGIDKFQFSNIPFDVMPTSSHVLSGDMADGTLIINCFTLAATEILYSTHRVRLFYPGGLTADQVRAEGFDPDHAIPLTSVPSTFQFLVPISLPQGTVQKTVNFILSTETGTTALPDDLIKSLNLPGLKPSDAANSLVHPWSIPSLTLGNQSLSNVQIVSLSASQNATWHGLPLLGTDVLSHFDILLDLPSLKMYLKPITSAPSGKGDKTLSSTSTKP